MHLSLDSNVALHCHDDGCRCLIATGVDHRAGDRLMRTSQPHARSARSSRDARTLSLPQTIPERKPALLAWRTYFGGRSYVRGSCQGAPGLPPVLANRLAGFALRGEF